MMKHQARKRSRATSPEHANDDDSERLKIQKSNLNASAGGEIYEKAKSRRHRHRLALMSSDQSSKAVPLGKSGKRGPGRTASLAGETMKNQGARRIRFGTRERDEEAEKVRELIETGRVAMERKPKNSLTLRKASSSRLNSTVSRSKITKNVEQSRSNLSVSSSGRAKRTKEQKPPSPNVGRQGKGRRNK